MKNKKNYDSRKKAIIICTVIIFILIVIASILIYNKYNNSENENSNKSLAYNESNVITIQSSDDMTNDGLIIDELKKSETERNISKVKMTIKDEKVTSEEMKIIIEDENETPYVYDSWFEIEKLENNEWKKIQYLNSYVSDDMSPMIYEMKDGKLEEEIDWEKEYGSLSKGKYKLIKRCMDEDDTYKYLEVQFEIK